MEGKLIKNHYGFEYFLMDEKGETIATSESGKLSLKNCEAIENGYDLDELVNEEFSKFDQEVRIVYRRQLQESLGNMFQKALEILCDKKFSEYQVRKALSMSRYKSRGEFIHSFQTILDELGLMQQTEWDVEIEMDFAIYPANLPKEGEERPAMTPKLDAEGCLILKRK